MQVIVAGMQAGKIALTVFLVCLLAASVVAVGSVVVPPATGDPSRPSKLLVTLAPGTVIAEGVHEHIILVSLQDASGNPAYATSDITLEMNSSDPAVGTIYTGYAPYMIRKGETFKAVTFAGVYISSTSRRATGQTWITASAPGLTSNRALLTVVEKGGAVAKLKLYAPIPTILVNGNYWWPIVGQLLDSRGVPTYPTVGQIITAPLSSSNTSVIAGGGSFGFYGSGAYFNYVSGNVRSLAPGQANITASATGLTADSITITSIPAGDFSLSASPQNIRIKPGENIEFTVTATLLSGTADMAGFPNWVVQVWWENNSGITGLPTRGVYAVRGFPASNTVTPTGTATFRFATDSNVPPGTYTITITGLYRNSGGLSATRKATVTLTIATSAAAQPAATVTPRPTPGSGGVLNGSGAPTGNVDLSNEGATDWAHWGLLDASSFNHKSGVTQLISDVTKIGNDILRAYNNNPTSYSWTGGTPTAGAANTTTGIYTCQLDNGLQISVPAGTTQKTLKVYVGVWCAIGKFEATLSDSSAAAYTDYIDNSAGTTNRVYTLTFRAGSDGQTLTVKFTVTRAYNAYYGNVALQAATLY